jgi:hypothetical protein
MAKTYIAGFENHEDLSTSVVFDPLFEGGLVVCGWTTPGAAVVRRLVELIVVVDVVTLVATSVDSVTIVRVVVDLRLVAV